MSNIKTLRRWVPLLEAQDIVTSETNVIARDHDPVIMTGEGRIDISHPARFSYIFRGVATDLSRAVDRLMHARRNPYDGLSQFRIEGVDQGGTKWSYGYVRPNHIDHTGEQWTLAGDCNGLITDDPDAHTESGVELIFLVPPELNLGALMTDTERPDGEPLLRTHACSVLGAMISFAYEPSTHRLYVTAKSSEALRHPYLENWLGEPFRILFGQLIYPRLVARNFGDGRAMIGLRPSPGLEPDAGFAALWSRGRAEAGRKSFWLLYEKLLTIIATDKDDKGHPNFEAHKITALYGEIIQAARGSRWVWALTMASAAEGLTKLIMPMLGIKIDPILDEEIDKLAAHIESWPGSAELKRRAVNGLKRARDTTTVVALRRLRELGVLEKDHLGAWETLRHAVMHGSMLAPWSTEEEDKRLLDLSELMHRLTFFLCGAVASATTEAVQ
ncbi:hypothetical protein U91I_01014 [alpha proteobacterium U9-1i]|nr:hypothetical protein U91I_01014 [alpha proteobacterium U9-1i]